MLLRGADQKRRVEEGGGEYRMGEENIVVYNENVARNIVKNGTFRNYDGNEIGTMENLIAEFTDAFFQISAWTKLKATDAEVKDAMYNYRAVKYCYSGNTFGMDNKISEKLSNYCQYLEQEYKFIN